MSPLQLLKASLTHHARIHLAVALGVVATTAVLTGALLVGDSVRGSLRDLTLDRLGRIDEVLVTEQFFREELVAELSGQAEFKEQFSAAVPAVLVRGTVENPGRDGSARAHDVTVLGCDDGFWSLGPGGPRSPITAGDVVLNQPLADELGAKVDDELLVRISLAGDIPADSPLGKKSDRVRSRRLRVAAIIPAEGLGRFGLRPSQQLPLNAYVATQALQEMLEQPAKVNAIFVAGQAGYSSQSLADALQPQPIDYGLAIERVRIGDPQAPVADYFNITSEQMMLPEAVVEAATREFADEGVKPALTYLANTITSDERKIPYSTITGMDWSEIGPLTDDQIVLNRWAADDLKVQPGDRVTVTYYEPESTHGELREAAPVSFRVHSIVPFAAPDEPPTRYNDPHLTPELRGVTDQKSIREWELPFELVETIRDRDEDYWDNYRATPKAFVSLATARRLWTSRFGDTTSLRIPTRDGLTVEAIVDRMALDPARLGFVFQPVKRQGLAAAQGTTSFNMLFLGFSFFIIASAVMLTALLFRLGTEQRAGEIGTLLAVGFGRRRIGWLLAAEGLAVAALGALAGVAGGVAYAWAMLAGLRTWWLAAVSTPFLRLHVTPTSLVLGYVIGVVVSLLAILWALRRMRRVPVRRLLAGQANEEAQSLGRPSLAARRIAQGMLLVAILVALSAVQLRGEAQAGAFFGSGSLVLAGALTLIWTTLRSGGAVGHRQAGIGLLGLAIRNGARNPGRSTLTIGLVAAATFLIVAMSAFRLDTTEEGTGGFAVVAESDQPILHDINTESGRLELGFSTDDSELLERSETYSLRVRAGDDASCLNLYKPQQPRVLGVPEAFIERGGFAWSDTLAETDAERKNPWLLLTKPERDGAVPVVLDANTATYSLHLGGVGSRFEIGDSRGGKIQLKVVGLLKNSIFQGELLVSEANFLEHFPHVEGYRFFLVDVPASESERPVQQALERTGDWGLDATSAHERLAGLLAVQNTYLSTFQSLGALGLLLGTFGLATVELRSVLERRGELALMRAAGFGRAALARLVMLENAMLLFGGLATGVAAALVAVLPHLLLGGAAIPWRSLAGMLAVVLVVGLVAGTAAVRATLRAPLVAALRGD